VAEIVEQGFAVTDKVAGTIAPKLDQIALASGRAALSEQKLAQAVARTQSVQYAALTSMQRMVTETGRAKVANTNAAISEQRLAQETLKTAVSQDKAALSALRLAQSRQKASQAAEKQAQSESRLGRMGAGLGGAIGGGIGGVGGAIKGAALGAISSGNPAQMAIGATTLAAGAGISTLVEYGDAYAGIQNSLKNVTGSLETTGVLMHRLNEIATATRTPLDAIAEGYGRFHRALSPLGKSQQEVMEFQETLNTMLFQYGKTGGEAASATLQLTQAMGKGKLDGDEFRSVMENLPELGTAIAKELGVMKGELLELAPQGKITGEVIFNAMMKAKEGLDALPDPATRVGGSLTLLTNSATLFFGELEKSLGIVAAFTSGLNLLSDALSLAAKRKADFERSKLKLQEPDKVNSYFNVPEELKGDAEVIASRDRLLKKEQDLDNFHKNAHRGNVAQRTKQLEIDRADYVEAQNQFNALLDRKKAEQQAIKHTAEVDEKATRDAANKKQKSLSAAAKHEKAYLAEVAEARKAYIEAGMSAGSNTTAELGRQFDYQQSLVTVEEKRLLNVERLALLHERIADANKQATDTTPVGFVSDPTSQTGIAHLEEQRLNTLLGVQSGGQGNAMGEDFYAQSGQLIDLDKAREEMRKKREEASKRTIDNDPYLAKKDLDRRTEQLGDYGTDFEFQAKASEELYARIAEMRKLDLLNEQETSNAKMRIWQAEQQNKLGLATTFFDNFIGLQRSENKEVAAIGKAAAIANATITTYQAANAAYAAMAGIPVVGPALGAAAAAAAIASGIVNIQAIAAAPTGFKAGGYTGNMPANDVAGVVHGREYVIDAASTARIGRQNLDALRSGNAAVAPSGGSGGGGPTIVNVAVFGTEEAAMAWLQGKEGEKQIVNAVTKNARTVGRAIKAAS
jgi:tape measure domain-containing protein